MRHANLSIFVPHAGCPHQCSFCSQGRISGTALPPDGPEVAALCAKCAEYLSEKMDAEIAFFGGSFTALDKGYMEELLKAAFPFVENGSFRGIRISTRPDYIDEDVLSLLAHYGVTAIELGAQSMDNAVLQKNERGHCAADVENAAELVKKAGFSLGLQMMTGLFGSDSEKEYSTALKLAALKPDTMRIYPTIVLEGTVLGKLYRQGVYKPQTLAAAVELCAGLLELFQQERIRVIRVGLHDEPSLRAARLAGPYHPAFRELCEGVLMARRAEKLLANGPRGHRNVYVAPASVSKMCGHGAFPVEYLRRLGYNITIRQDKALSGLEIRVEDVDDAPAQLGDTGIQVVPGQDKA